MYSPILIQELDFKAKLIAHNSTLKHYPDPNDYRIGPFDEIHGSKEALAHYSSIYKETSEKMLNQLNGYKVATMYGFSNSNSNFKTNSKTKPKTKINQAFKYLLSKDILGNYLKKNST